MTPVLLLFVLPHALCALLYAILPLISEELSFIEYLRVKIFSVTGG
jgi:hypothetical protein